MVAERMVISIKPTKETYEKLKAARDEWFTEERKINPEVRGGWLSFILAMFRVWEESKEVKNA